MKGMHATRVNIVVALSAAVFAMGCDKSFQVEAVSISDANGKTIALDGDPSAVYLSDHELKMPVEVAFRATGEERTLGCSLNLDSFNMAQERSPNCEVTRLGSCSGEVCTTIVRWNEPGYCAFHTRVSDTMGAEVASCRGIFVGKDAATEEKASEALEGGFAEERRRRCRGEVSW